MQTHMRAFVDIIYDHAREVKDTDLAGTIASAVHYMNTTSVFNYFDDDGVVLAVPVAVSLSIGTVWPGGATMRVSDTIVVKDVREIVAE